MASRIGTGAIEDEIEPHQLGGVVWQGLQHLCQNRLIHTDIGRLQPQLPIQRRAEWNQTNGKRGGTRLIGELAPARLPEQALIQQPLVRCKPGIEIARQGTHPNRPYQALQHPAMPSVLPGTQCLRGRFSAVLTAFHQLADTGFDPIQQIGQSQALPLQPLNPPQVVVLSAMRHGRGEPHGQQQVATLAGRQADFLAHLGGGHRRVRPQQQEHLLLGNGGMNRGRPLHPGGDALRSFPDSDAATQEALINPLREVTILAGKAKERAGSHKEWGFGVSGDLRC